MDTPNNVVESPVTEYLFKTAEQYESYLELTKPTLLNPMQNTPEYVRERARQIPPMGFVMRTDRS